MENEASLSMRDIHRGTLKGLPTPRACHLGVVLVVLRKLEVVAVVSVGWVGWVGTVLDETFQWQGNDARSWGGIGPSLEWMPCFKVHMTRSLSLGHPAPLLQMIKKPSEPHLSTFNGNAIRIKFLVQTFPNSFFLLITLVSRCNTCWRLRSTLLSFTCILSLRYLRSLCAFDCDGKVGFLNMTKLKSLSGVEFKPWTNWDNLHSCTSGTPCQLFETLQMPFQCQHFKTLQNTSKHFKTLQTSSQIEGQISSQSGGEIYAIVVDRFDYVTPW